MKKQLEALRLAMQQGKQEAMNEADMSTFFTTRQDIVENYFDGYDQALRDVEEADPAAGIDLIDEIEQILQKFDEYINQARAEAESYEDEDAEEMGPEQAFAEGCASAYRKARWRIGTILDKVNEAIIARESEPVMG